MLLSLVLKSAWVVFMVGIRYNRVSTIKWTPGFTLDACLVNK